MIHIKELNHFPGIKARVFEAFPEFDDAAVTHAANNITNEIRRCGHDCCDVEVSRSPMDDNGFYHLFEVSARGVTVYVRLTVD